MASDTMRCALCEKEIEKYDASFNHLKIDETRSADICNACVDKFLAWQQGKLATLFPTKTAKRFYKR